MATSATYQALNTFEIVSNVVSNLPKIELARVAQTAWIWRNAVEETPSTRELRNDPAVESAAQADHVRRHRLDSTGCYTYVANARFRRVDFLQYLDPSS
jgi:hypothetical protein